MVSSRRISIPGRDLDVSRISSHSHRAGREGKRGRAWRGPGAGAEALVLSEEAWTATKGPAASGLPTHPGGGWAGCGQRIWPQIQEETTPGVALWLPRPQPRHPPHQSRLIQPCPAGCACLLCASKSQAPGEDRAAAGRPRQHTPTQGPRVTPRGHQRRVKRPHEHHTGPPKDQQVSQK